MPLTDQQKSQLADVYDDAMKAGDTAAAARVRDVLSRDRTGEAPKKPSESMQLPGSYTPGGGQFTPESAPDIGSGLAEGLKRDWAGVKQVASGIADKVTGLPLAGRGQKDLVTAAENLRQKLDQQDPNNQRPLREAAAQIGSAAPLAVAPEMALPRATTLLGAAAKNAVSGGIGGAMSFDAKGQNLRNAEIGAVVAPALGTAFAVAPAIKNRVAAAVQDAYQGSRTQAAVDAVKGIMPGMKLSLSQRTGIPALKTLEGAAYNSDLVKFYADQTDNFVKDFVDVMSQPTGAVTRDVDGAFLAAQTKAEGLLDKAKVRSSDQYEAGMSKAATLNEPRPGQATQIQPLRIPVGDLKEQVKYMTQLQADKLANGGQSVVPAEWLAAAQRATGKGFLTPKELAGFLRGATAAAKNGNPVEQANVGRLRDALDNDLGRMEQDATLKSNEAAQTILETRAEYKRARAAIETMANSGAYKLLGVKAQEGAEVGADTLLARFNEMTPAKQRQVQKYLGSQSPDLLASMKQQYVDEAKQAATTLGPAADSRQSVDSLADNLFDAKRGHDLRSSGLWSPEELKKVEAVKEGIRLIKNNRPELGRAGTPIKPEDVVINLVSRSGAFASRQLTRILAGSKGAQFFTDPDVYKAMTVLNRTTTGTAGNLTARAALIDVLNDKYPEEEKPE